MTAFFCALPACAQSDETRIDGTNCTASRVARPIGGGGPMQSWPLSLGVVVTCSSLTLSRSGCEVQ